MEIPGSDFTIPADIVVVAIGTKANPLLTASVPGLKLNDRGYIEIDAEGMTSLPGVFSGGDIVRGSATVIAAMGDGKRAAAAIGRYLANKQTKADPSDAASSQVGVARIRPSAVRADDAGAIEGDDGPPRHPEEVGPAQIGITEERGVEVSVGKAGPR